MERGVDEYFEINFRRRIYLIRFLLFYSFVPSFVCSFLHFVFSHRIFLYFFQYEFSILHESKFCHVRDF